MLLVPVALGCNTPRYSYEPPPPVALPAPNDCYERARVAAATGRFSWDRNLGGGATVSRGVRGEHVITYGPTVAESHRGRGLTLYVDGRRLSSLEGLGVIGADAARKAQTQLLADNGGAYHGYPVTRWAMLGLAGVGTAAVVVGTPIMLAEASEDSNTGALILLGGVVALAASLIPALIGYSLLPGHVLHERDQKLIVHREIGVDTVAAVRSYNRSLAQTCGAAPADDGISSEAKALVGTPGN